jgi:hypothetical protein
VDTTRESLYLLSGSTVWPLSAACASGTGKYGVPPAVASADARSASAARGFGVQSARVEGLTALACESSTHAMYPLSAGLHFLSGGPLDKLPKFILAWSAR